MQPQGHFQVVTNTIDYLLNPQAALDMPRWQWMKGKVIHVEPEFPSYLLQNLIGKGHQIHVASDGGSFGRGQIIWRNDDTGVLQEEPSLVQMDLLQPGRLYVSRELLLL